MYLEHLTVKELLPNINRKKLNVSTDFVLPLYFEHKIADTFSSYKFYKKIIDKPINRSIIENIKIEDLIKTFKL